MTNRVVLRLHDILEAISDIRHLLTGKIMADIETDKMVRLPLERLLEIVSEALPHVPAHVTSEYGRDVSRRQVADLGDVLRNAHRDTDPKILRDIFTKDLTPLEHAEKAIIAVLAASPPAQPNS